MKVRGATTLFENVFYADEAPVVQMVPRKGRSTERDAQRNECLIDRYYFTGRESKCAFHILINQMADQFFISPSTVSNVIQANYSQLATLKKDSPAKGYFQKKWPHLVW